MEAFLSPHFLENYSTSDIEIAFYRSSSSTSVSRGASGNTCKVVLLGKSKSATRFNGDASSKTSIVHYINIEKEKAASPRCRTNPMPRHRRKNEYAR